MMKFRIVVGAFFASVDDSIVAAMELVEKSSYDAGIVADSGLEPRSREAHCQNEWHDIT